MAIGAGRAGARGAAEIAPRKPLHGAPVHLGCGPRGQAAQAQAVARREAYETAGQMAGRRRRRANPLTPPGEGGAHHRAALCHAAEVSQGPVDSLN